MTQPPPPFDSSDVLPYARREDTGLAAAYRLVGWFYLAVSLLSVLGGGVSLAFLATMGPSAGNYLNFALTTLPRALVLIGAVAMIRNKGWGALFVAAIYGLILLLGLVALGLQYMQFAGTTGSWVALSSMISTSLVNIAYALLPLGLWRICRNKGVLAS